MLRLCSSAPSCTHWRQSHLEGASLRDASGLTQEQLDVACGDDRTQLPDGLTRPNGWHRFTPETVEAFAREIRLHKIVENAPGTAGLS